MSDYSVGDDYNTSASNYGIGALSMGFDWSALAPAGSMFLGALGGFLGVGDNSDEIDRINRILAANFAEAKGELRKGISAAEQKEIAAQGQFRAAESAAKVGAGEAKRSSLAAQAEAARAAADAQARMRAQAASNLLMRGNMGTSVGGSMFAQASNAGALMGQQAAMQGGAMRANISQQLGGQLATLRSQSAGAYMAGANRTMQGAQSLAQLIGSYSPIADTGKGDFLSNLGGVAFGLGMESFLGGDD